MTTRKKIEAIGFAIVPDSNSHHATKLIMTESEFARLEALLTTERVEARMDEQYVMNKRYNDVHDLPKKGAEVITRETEARLAELATLKGGKNE